MQWGQGGGWNRGVCLSSGDSCLAGSPHPKGLQQGCQEVTSTEVRWRTVGVGLGAQRSARPPARKQEPVAKCRHTVMVRRPESLLPGRGSITHPAPCLPSPVHKVSPIQTLDLLASEARRDPESSLRPFPCLCACLSLQILGTEGASEMMQCLQSQPARAPQPPGGTFNKHRLFPHPEILMGICSRQLPAQPAHRPTFGNHSRLSRQLLNSCSVPGTVGVLGDPVTVMNR